MLSVIYSQIFFECDVTGLRYINGKTIFWNAFEKIYSTNKLAIFVYVWVIFRPKKSKPRIQGFIATYSIIPNIISGEM